MLVLKLSLSIAICLLLIAYLTRAERKNSKSRIETKIHGGTKNISRGNVEIVIKNIRTFKNEDSIAAVIVHGPLMGTGAQQV